MNNFDYLTKQEMVWLEVNRWESIKKKDNGKVQNCIQDLYPGSKTEIIVVHTINSRLREIEINVLARTKPVLWLNCLIEYPNIEDAVPSSPSKNRGRSFY